jgi:opine dehydrogenase
MSDNRVTVLGGGNTSFSLAANLALGGWDVMLWEHPDFLDAIVPIQQDRVIQLEGAARIGSATLAAITTDPAEALAWSDVLLAAVPSYAHQPFIDELLPHIRPGHLVALLPGNLGALAFARAIIAAGIDGVMVAEADTAPYVCRKTSPTAAVIWGTVSGLGIGVTPAARTDEAMARLTPLFPGTTAYPSVLAAGLSALNPIVHPPGVLMNAGRVERSRGEFWFYEEGVTPAVVAAIEALDAERLAIGAALDLDLVPVADAFHRAGFGPAGDLWSVINGSKMLTALRAPGAIATRWLTEDVPYGLVTWSALGAQLSVPTPVMDAIITLGSAVLGNDCRAEGRSLSDLGLEGETPTAIMDAAMG